MSSSAPATPTLLYRAIALVSRPVVERIYRLRVHGLEHVHAHGGFVVAANHTSNVDPRPLGIALWPRSLHFMAKYEAWKPPLKWVIAGVGSFPVRRGRRRSARERDAGMSRGPRDGDVPGGDAAHKGIPDRSRP